MIAALIGFAVAFGLIFLRVPVAIALALVGVGGVSYLIGTNPALSLVGLITSGTTMSFSPGLCCTMCSQPKFCERVSCAAQPPS